MTKFKEKLKGGFLNLFSARKKDSKASRYGTFPGVGFLVSDRKVRLEELIGYSVRNTGIYEQALTHRSYLQVVQEEIISNERLEFLGDSVLGMVIADYLFTSLYKVNEGELTKRRSWMVNKNTLAECAKILNLDKHLMLSFSASKSLETGSLSILADALEALIGAIYIDKGFNAAKDFILGRLLPLMNNRNNLTDTNYKSILLELVQSKGKPTPRYEVLEEYGPDHNKEFLTGVYVENVLVGKGRGRSKKEAEQFASRDALDFLKNQSEYNQENMLNL